MKKKMLRLVLHRETIHRLDEPSLREAAGGLVTGPHCPITTQPTDTCNTFCYTCTGTGHRTTTH